MNAATPTWARALGGATASLGRAAHAPRVSRLGLGCAGIGQLYRPVPEAEAQEVVRYALNDAGITLFDTAPFYGFGASEARLGAGLRTAGVGLGSESGGFGRERVQISTKVGRVLQHGAGDRFMWAGGLDFAEAFDYSAVGVERSYERSAARIGLPRPDFLTIHDLEPERHGEDGIHRRLDDLVSGPSPGWDLMTSMRDEGLVGGLGAGLNRLDMAREFWARGIDVDFFLVAGRLTLLENEAHDGAIGEEVSAFLRECEARGTRLMVGGVFNSGVLATGADDPGSKFDYGAVPAPVAERVRRLEAVCAAHDVPLPAAALQYPTVAHGQAGAEGEDGAQAKAGSGTVAAIIPGVDDCATLQANVGMLQRPAPEALWRDLRTEGLIA